MTAGELAVWHRTTAVEGAPRNDEEGLDAMFQQALADQHRLEGPEPDDRRAAWLAFLGTLGQLVLVLTVLALLIGVTS